MGKIEGLLPRIAVATFVYYCLTFAFEIGYFWKIGIGYMSAFSITEHSVHASSFVIGGAGVAIIIYFAIMYPAVGFTGEDRTPPFRPPSKTEKIHWTRRLAFFLLFTMFVSTFGWDEFPELVRSGFTPSSFFGLVFSVSMLAYFAMLTFRLPAIFCVYPAIIAAIISPVALGQLSYDSFTRAKSATFSAVTVDGKQKKAKVLFFGTDRMLIQTSAAPALVGYPDDAVRIK